MLNKIRKLKNKKGFTLVELIVVIAIIAVLTAVIVPLIGRYSTQAAYTTLQDAASTISSNVNTVLSDVAATGTPPTTTSIVWTSGNTTPTVTPADTTIAGKIQKSLENTLPKTFSIYVSVSGGAVTGVLYKTADNSAFGGSETATAVADFNDAYQVGSTAVGVHGSYKKNAASA